MQATETCCNCGIEFTMPADLQAALRRSHKTFYCPNGHGQHYSGETADQKRIAQLEKLLERARDRADRHFIQEQGAIGALKACPLRCGWHSRKRVGSFSGDDDAYERGLFRIQADVIDHLCSDHGLALPAEAELWLAEVAR